MIKINLPNCFWKVYRQLCLHGILKFMDNSLIVNGAGLIIKEPIYSDKLDENHGKAIGVQLKVSD